MHHRQFNFFCVLFVLRNNKYQYVRGWYHILGPSLIDQKTSPFFIDACIYHQFLLGPFLLNQTTYPYFLHYSIMQNHIPMQVSNLSLLEQTSIKFFPKALFILILGFVGRNQLIHSMFYFFNSHQNSTSI